MATASPYVFPRGVAIGPGGSIAVAGRVGENASWFSPSENSHFYMTYLASDGKEVWTHTYDAGGSDEKEWGSADGVGFSEDGRTVYMAGTLSYSGTGWKAALEVLAYENPTPSTPAVFRLEATGAMLADGAVYAASFRAGAADLAEWVPVSESVAAGDVLEFDSAHPATYRRASIACTSLVAGVVSSQPGVVLGDVEPEKGMALLALSGIIPVKVTNEGGPIQPGDLLVSSSTPGYAMRWAGPEPCPCSLVGKALEPMTDARGVISVLLTAH
jgi:hypothetical protein